MEKVTRGERWTDRSEEWVVVSQRSAWKRETAGGAMVFFVPVEGRLCNLSISAADVNAGHIMYQVTFDLKSVL